MIILTPELPCGHGSRVHPPYSGSSVLRRFVLKVLIKHFKGLSRNPCPLVTVLLTLSKKMTPHGVSLVRSTVLGMSPHPDLPRWPCLPSRCGRHSSIVPTLVGREDAQSGTWWSFGLSLVLSCWLPLLGSHLTLEPLGSSLSRLYWFSRNRLPGRRVEALLGMYYPGEGGPIVTTRPPKGNW